MQLSQNAVLEALLRAQYYFDENGVLFTSVDLAGPRKRLDDVVASFTSHAFDQDVGSRGAKGETAKQRQLRVKLRREQIAPIAKVARRNLRSTPEFVALQMPKPTLKGQGFVASARGMADAATAHKDVLLAQGLPSTFLDDLKTGVTNLEGSLSDREQNLSRRVSATKGLAVEEKNGRLILSVLDALVQQALGNNEPALRGWQAARLIRRRQGGASTTTATSTPAALQTSAGATAAASSAVTALPVSESKPVAAAA